ncbi:MAG: lytic murein transglycosylase [Chromatiales bacterium]|nr:lytic murein transglycosylase [Chromatiales bacterium]
MHRRVAHLVGVLLVIVSAAPSAQDISRCLASLRPQAVKAGVSAAAFDRHTRAVVADPTVLERLDYQPEFRTAIWDYLAGLVDEERVTDGRRMLVEWRDTLAAVEARFGVDPATVVAVWGVESDYGRRAGGRPLVTSLATLSCLGRRQSFFRRELLATIAILEELGLDTDALVGSWAGAFGQTQFIPTTYQRVAVDFDGDGRRDLVGSVPDALGSTASYLERSGWRSGERWGLEVVLPRGFDPATAGRRNRRPLGEWAAMGVRPVDGGALPDSSSPAAVLLPAGPDGPAFLVLRNFDAIYAYNAAESYALAIAHLSDRLRGAGPFVRPWPTDDPGLSRRERRELQQRLVGRGHDIGEVDGLIGDRTRRAIQAEQRRLGLEPDGRAGQRILEALRAGG